MKSRWRRLGMLVTLVALMAVLERSTAAPLQGHELDPLRLASAEVWSRDHELLSLRANDQGERCAWRQLEELDARVVDVFVAAEDQRFFEHAGVDLRAIARAALRGGSGASTISMQLARLVRPHRRTLSGKLAEALLAVRLERTLSKHDILEQYLNRVPLGRNIRGVEAAAWAYFGHSARTLSLAEAGLLAALAPAPSRLDPRESPQAARVARDQLLTRLAARGQLPAEDVATSAAVPVAPPAGWPERAAHVVASVPSAPGQTRLLIDAAAQSHVEAIARSHRQRLAILGADAIAIVVIEHRTNGLVALVGSFAFDEPPSGQVNHAKAARQAGSALKPFLYALLLEDGASPETPVPDVARGFREGESIFLPRNNDDLFRGMVPLRVALGSSFNVPAVATAELVGLARFRSTLESLGLRLERPTESYGLGLALGVADVRLLDLTSAFSVFARAGVWSPPRVLADEEVVPETRVFSAATAQAIFEILSDEQARVPGFGEYAHLGLPFPVALKTGTSSAARDFWALGSTAEHTVGVWAGNSNGSPAADTVSIEVAVPILVDVFAALANAPVRLPFDSIDD